MPSFVMTNALSFNMRKNEVPIPNVGRRHLVTRISMRPANEVEYVMDSF
jgi:hypothetical protein